MECNELVQKGPARQFRVGEGAYKTILQPEFKSQDPML